jgi:hypothetical protein
VEHILLEHKSQNFITMAQNLISATLSATEATEILQSLNAVKSKMPFLSTLQATYIKYLKCVF